MLEPRIAIELSCLGLPLRRALPYVAELGVRGIEIDMRGELNAQELSQTGLRQVRKLIDDHGLRVVAAEFRTRRGYHVADELERRVEATKAAMTLAASLGARVLTNQLGSLPAEASGPEALLLEQVLTDLGAHGNRVGTFFCAETAFCSGEQLMQFLNSLPAGVVGVTLNPGNLVMVRQDPVAAVHAVASRLLHVRVRDAVADLSGLQGVEVTLGRGSVDWPAVLGALEEHDYQGWLSIERRQAEQPADEIRDAVAYLKNL